MKNGHSNESNGDGEDRVALHFPCRVHIKAVGRHNSRFEALVHSIVSRHIAPADLLATSSRVSRGGNYLAVTLTISAGSRNQLDSIYRDLTDCKEVLIAL